MTFAVSTSEADPSWRIDIESAMAALMADGTLGRSRRDDCEAAWVDVGGES